MQVSPVIEEKATENLESREISIRQLKQAYQNLEEYLNKLKQTKDSMSAEEHEAAILRFTQAIGQAGISEMLELYDISDDVISLGSQTYRRKHKASRTYQTSLGPVKVMRHVYVNRKRDGSGKSICPLELQSGIVEGYWSANAAKNSAWLLAHLTPQETEEALLQLGMMNPSRSSLDRSGPQILDKRLIDLDNVLLNAGENQNAKKKTKPFPIL